ncbi:hypothetical protein ACROYT_G007077 [Oculina patagonica]
MTANCFGIALNTASDVVTELGSIFHNSGACKAPQCSVDECGEITTSFYASLQTGALAVPPAQAAQDAQNVDGGEHPAALAQVAIPVETLLDRALDFAAEHVNITADKRLTIINSKHSLLFGKGQPWEKRTSTSNFDVTMGSYDGVETCELVGCNLLSQLKQIDSIEIGLYRDDGLAILNQTPREMENAKKQTCRIFANNNLVSIAVEVYHCNVPSNQVKQKPSKKLTTSVEKVVAVHDQEPKALEVKKMDEGKVVVLISRIEVLQNHS